MERGGSRLVSRVIGTRRRRRRLSTSWKCRNRGLGAARCRGRFPSAAAAPVMRHNQIACMRRDRATTTGPELGHTGWNGRVIGLVRLMSAGGRRPAALHGRRPKTSFANDISATSARRSARYRHTSIPPTRLCRAMGGVDLPSAPYLAEASQPSSSAILSSSSSAAAAAAAAAAALAKFKSSPGRLVRIHLERCSQL